MKCRMIGAEGSLGRTHQDVRWYYREGTLASGVVWMKYTGDSKPSPQYINTHESISLTSFGFFRGLICC